MGAPEDLIMSIVISNLVGFVVGRLEEVENTALSFKSLQQFPFLETPFP